mgnify:CR=1 FL=1
MIATDALVRVHPDGGITTIARSGNGSQKWYQLEGGKRVEVSPPKKPESRYKGDFVLMGKESLDAGVERKLSSLNIDKDAFLKDYQNPQFKQAMDKKPELVEGWKIMDDLGEELARKNVNVLENIDKVLKNNDLKNLGLDKHKLKEALEQRIDELDWETVSDFNTMLKSMLPPNKNDYILVGMIENNNDLLTYRFLPNYNKFSQKKGILKSKVGNHDIIPPRWESQNEYEKILNFTDQGLVAKGYKTGIDLFNRDFNNKIAFGLDNGLEAFAQKGGLLHYVNARGNARKFWDEGYCQVSDGIKLFQEMFFQTIVHLRLNRGRIHFKLDGIDKIKVRIWDNPDKVIRGDPNKIFTYTNFELRQIARNKDWFDNTIWYQNGVPIPENVKLQVLKDKFGIEPLFK